MNQNEPDAEDENKDEPKSTLHQAAPQEYRFPLCVGGSSRSGNATPHSPHSDPFTFPLQSFNYSPDSIPKSRRGNKVSSH